MKTLKDAKKGDILYRVEARQANTVKLEFVVEKVTDTWLHIREIHTKETSKVMRNAKRPRVRPTELEALGDLWMRQRSRNIMLTRQQNNCLKAQTECAWYMREHAADVRNVYDFVCHICGNIVPANAIQIGCECGGTFVPIRKDD